jgi:hypothetical protein
MTQWSINCINGCMRTPEQRHAEDSLLPTYTHILDPHKPQVCEREFEFPPDFPPEARDLVDRLLAMDPAERIGECVRGG